MSASITAEEQLARLLEEISKMEISVEPSSASANTEEKRPDGTTPQGPLGPYYVPFDDTVVRSDICEGRPGIPLELRFTVVDATRARPIAGALVDLWHADAFGWYSGHLDADPDNFPALPPGFTLASTLPTSDDSRFLRGVQYADDHGVAVFRTIYPGWYFGRCLHMHLKVHVGGKNVYTGQLYLPEEYNETIEKLPPYSQHSAIERVRNADDLLYKAAGGPDAVVDVAPVTPGRPELGLIGSFAVALR